jgi:hypothetical protein
VDSGARAPPDVDDRSWDAMIDKPRTTTEAASQTRARRAGGDFTALLVFGNRRREDREDVIFGKNATRRAAIAPGSESAGGRSGNDAMRAAKRRVAVSLGNPARLAASRQGSRSWRASAEATLSDIPLQSSPTEANRKASNSCPRNASWVRGDACSESENMGGVPLFSDEPLSQSRGAVMPCNVGRDRVSRQTRKLLTPSRGPP